MTQPTKINDDSEYTDYELYHELPSFDDPASNSVANEHSIIVRLCYDHDNQKAYGHVTHEVNGQHFELGDLKLSNAQFYRITGHPMTPQDKLTILRKINGSASFKNGLVAFEDGTTLTL
jgi:hypothetical protein